MGQPLVAEFLSFRLSERKNSALSSSLSIINLLLTTRTLRLSSFSTIFSEFLADFFEDFNSPLKILELNLTESSGRSKRERERESTLNHHFNAHPVGPKHQPSEAAHSQPKAQKSNARLPGKPTNRLLMVNCLVRSGLVWFSS